MDSHKDLTRAVISSDDKHIISGSWDCILKIWRFKWIYNIQDDAE